MVDPHRWQHCQTASILICGEWWGMLSKRWMTSWPMATWSSFVFVDRFCVVSGEMGHDAEFCFFESFTFWFCGNESSDKIYRYTSKRLLLSTYLLLCTAVVVETFAFLEAVLLRARRIARRSSKGCRREAFTPCWSTALNAGWTFFAIAWYFFQKGKCYHEAGDFSVFFLTPKKAGDFLLTRHCWSPPKDGLCATKIASLFFQKRGTNKQWQLKEHL